MPRLPALIAPCLSLSLMLACLPALAHPEPAASLAQNEVRQVPGGIIAPDLSWREIAPGALIISHSTPYQANMVLVEMANGDLVLVDTTYDDAAANLLLDWIQRRYGMRRLVAINTHFHVDRIGGNAALIARGVPVYGSDRIAPLLAERGEAMRRLMLESFGGQPALTRAFLEMRFTAPDHTFPLAQGLSLDFGDERVEVLFTGGGHAPDNVTVWFPRQRLLAGGCMILAGESAGNTRDAEPATWAEAVRALQRLDPAIVVPGHGQRSSPDLLAHTLAVLQQAGLAP